ncbi:nucleotidyltransferase family protein [Vibrio fluvialis]|nr:nucleotidyltransferase family protein [Vibrio fluvialis]MBY7954335.1 nucleotidyltransferase family protein [Vibrio fluvialis]MBY8065451.1 nucleotidyltransferase family protein [Vibrio fluvialis]MBY8134227.1 nucleotidyltransferase family protein [Vibrio fluvialis]
MMNEWQKSLVASDATLKECMEVINKNIVFKIAVVVETDFTIKGVVTDGDIRRALLNGKNLDTLATVIMNADPVTISKPYSRTSACNLMLDLGISSLPVTNDENKVVDIAVLRELSEEKVLNNPVFLMAGGFGTRLRPLTDNCPKPMLQIGPRPLLETLIMRLKGQGFRNFFFSTHYLAEQIRQHFGDGSKFGINVTYVHEEKPLGTAGALSLLPSSRSQLPLLMLNGDILTNVNFAQLLEFHNDHGNSATMCVKKFEYQVPYGVIKGKGHEVTSIVEKPTHSFFVNAGIYVLNSSVINSLKKEEVKDMPSLLDEKIQVGERVSMFPIHEYWLDIGRMEDFNKAQKDFYNLGLE